ncbi:LysR family transcriptional regulator [Cupriavidus sp. L7L]|uniref:LysR family transcriptional regulator n=1 Tax=Cupriavidus sp. L7L TaxID=2546443 RepID=UPI0010552F6B|nr:LysR family transcriptional regulator [Cupriavidus sp. L7L]TDF64531.1 LysR family transcriptional regulator [Cupriavidus sp. L7L]
MDSTALLYLVEIVDAGNISAASRRLKMTRANVSYHLNQLERSVGAQLLRRTTRSLELTEIGQRLYQQGCVIKNALAAANEAASLGQTLHGRIRLSVPNGYGQLVMTPWLLEFKRLHPGINLDVIFENRIQDLIRDEVDIAVRVLSEPPQNLEARDLGPVHIVACASRGFAAEHGLPRNLEELRSFPVITASVIGKQLRVAATLKGTRSELLLEPSLASDNFLFLRDAILDGLGVGLVADYLVRNEIASGSVVPTLDEWQLSIFGNRMHLLFMPDRYHTRAVSTLVEFLTKKARAS